MPLAKWRSGWAVNAELLGRRDTKTDLGTDHVIGNLACLRPAGHNMEPGLYLDRPPTSLGASSMGPGLVHLDLIKGAEERWIWILGGADTTFLDHNGGTLSL